MSSRALQTIHLLLIGALFLSAVPWYAQRHSHSDGAIPHQHTYVHQAGDSDKRAEHEHDSAGHHHHHNGPSAQHVDEARHDRQAETIGVSWNANPDWHSHGWWFGWLIGSDWSSGPPTVTPGLDSAETGLVTSDARHFQTSFHAELQLVPIGLHGPPEWLGPAWNSIWRVSLNSRSSLAWLCDTARRERTGVLLI